MSDAGLPGDWIVNYIVPGPFPMDEVACAIEATRQRPNGYTELKIFTFHARRRSGQPYLELLQTFAEPEYASLLRRRHRDITFYYTAQQTFRRRLVAKVLAGGDEIYQLLLGPVVDDEELRLQLRSPKYNPAKSAKSKAELARKRMNDFRQARSEQAREGVTLTDEPETNRGIRAQSANHRRRDNEDRQRSRRNPLQAAMAEFAISPTRRGT